MKKSWFDPRLYREGLRQLRVIGVLSLVLMTLAAVLAPVGQAIQIAADQEIAAAAGRNISIENLTLLGSHPLLLLGFPVLAPAMSLYLFHFLDRREACDFYHALPQTRGCLYRSFAAALLTWLVGVLLASTLVNMGVCALLGRYLALVYSSVPVLLFNLTAASVLVAAGTVLAMSLTGTVFTNIVSALLILFVPRIFMQAVSSFLGSAMPYVSESHLFPLLDYSWNLVSGLPLSYLLGTYRDVVYGWHGGLYTLALGAVYLVLGGLFFRRRKSEAAGQAALSRGLQLAFRLAAALTICLIPMGMIFEALVTGGGLSRLGGSWFFSLLVAYLIAAIVYFLYELISTRKLRNLARAVPGLGILAVLNLVLVLGMFGVYRYTSAQQPAAEEISYVTLPSEGNVWVSYGSGSGGQEVEDYFGARLEEVRLDSPETRQLISQRLSQTIAYYREDSGQSIREMLEGSQAWSRLVRIQAGHKTLYRYVYLTEADRQLLARELQNKAEAAAVYQDLPAEDLRETWIHSSDRLTDAAAGRVYQSLRQEAAAMDFMDWYSLVEGGNPDLENTVVGYLTLITYWQNRGLGTDLPISTQMPETFRIYMEEQKEAQRQDVAALAESLEKGSGMLTSLYAAGYEDGHFAFYGNRDFIFDPYTEEEETLEAEPVQTEQEAVDQEASTDMPDEPAERKASREAGEALAQLLAARWEAPVTGETDFLNLELTYFDDGEYYNLDFYVAVGREDIPPALQEILMLLEA